MPNILLGVTGSVAAIKLTELLAVLGPLGSVRVVLTSSAQLFVRGLELPPGIFVYDVRLAVVACLLLHVSVCRLWASVAWTVGQTRRKGRERDTFWT
jgi:hypothetical protein